MPACYAMIWDTACSDADAFAGTIRRRINSSDHPAAPDIDRPGLLFLDLTHPGQREDLLSLEGNDGQAEGLVFGTLFETVSGRQSHHPVQAFSRHTSEAILSSCGKALMHTHWGRYLAIVKTLDGSHILLDPTGALPCYYTVQKGVLLLFSHLELCHFLDLSRFRVNSEFVKMQLTYDRFLNGQTGLSGVHELLGGQCLTYDRSGIRISAPWSPERIAHRPLDIPDRDAAQRLRETTDNVVGSWATRYDHVAVSLSGGLDSSIVLDCLARSDATAAKSAFHYLLASEDADELHFAKLAARSAGCPLDILNTSPAALPVLRDYPPTVRPYREFLAPRTGGHFDDREQPPRAAIFTGQGGDHLFLATRDTARFADFLMQHGLSGEAGQMLLQTARLSGKSVFAVVRETVPQLLSRRYRGATERGIQGRRTALSGDDGAGAAIIASLPDWARQPGRLPPAKFQQVSSLLHMVQSRSHLPAPPQSIINPLISQPLIELCLRLPACQLTLEGHSRGLVRQAFADRLPAAISQRVTKGSASRFYTSQIAAVHDFAGPLLRNGELVSRGWVSPVAVDQMLGRSTFRTTRSGSMLLVYCGIESWLRTWSGISGSSSSPSAGR